MKQAFQFFTEDLPSFSPLPNPTDLERWLSDILSAYRVETFAINYIFCSDAYLHQINLDFLAHDTYTDIITFDNSSSEDFLEADVFISVERVEENAQTFATTFSDELHRVMAHGLLHLCGYGDKTQEEADEMRKEEDHALSLRRFVG